MWRILGVSYGRWPVSARLVRCTQRPLNCAQRLQEPRLVDAEVKAYLCSLNSIFRVPALVLCINCSANGEPMCGVPMVISSLV